MKHAHGSCASRADIFWRQNGWLEPVDGHLFFLSTDVVGVSLLQSPDKLVRALVGEVWGEWCVSVRKKT